MRVTWYGHACFRLEGSGVSIVTDPYTPEDAGLGAVEEPADAVVMSSAFDVAHSNAAMIQGAPRVLNALEAVERPVPLVDGITVEAVAAMEGADRPDDPKANAMYRLVLDGLAVCHMGDVGNALTEVQLAPLRGRIDVLLALVGGNLTIALPDLDVAIDQLAPRIVIPMHYRTPSLRYECLPLDDFLDRHREVPIVRHQGSTLELDRARLPATIAIHVLDPLLDRGGDGGPL